MKATHSSPLCARPRLAHLRCFAITHSLATPSTLGAAISRLGFVQADPIRAPARAQDLTLRHRVANYRAGDLEARYPRLAVEEDFFVNYGFVTRAIYAAMHPRRVDSAQGRLVTRHGAEVLAFVRDRGVVHPREVDAQFRHGTTRNAWGGQSSLTTHLLDGMHYRGMLRVARREGGVRLYALPRIDPSGVDNRDVDATLDSFINVLMTKYAPMPHQSLQSLLGRLHHAVPQWRPWLATAIGRAKARWPQSVIDGTTWYWPEGARVDDETDDQVRLLAPFDPIVWDRRRFEMLWGWAYRFEAYTPAAKRKLGYYALPMLWGDQVVGWANVSVVDGRTLAVECGYSAGRAPRARQFRIALDEEVERLRVFLGDALNYGSSSGSSRRRS